MRKNSAAVVSSPIGGAKASNRKSRALTRDQQTNQKEQGANLQKQLSSSVSANNKPLIHGQNSSFQYEYKILEKLGSGMYGEIFKVSRKRDNKVFVLKKVPLDGLTVQQINLSMSEHLVMRKLDHPNIVKFHESCVDGRAIQIIMEHAPRGDLSEMIELQTRNKTLFDEKVLWEYLIQICEGLAYLHANRILHRDIKAQNIFLDANLNIKIGDLGLVREFGPASVNAFSQVGTPLYFSPELCKEEPYNEKSDVWSFGCLMYEMACLRKPFEAKTTMALMRKICYTDPPQIPDVYSKELQFVITKMLEKDANLRPTVGQILGYGPVLKLLPDSKFRRKVEALNKYRDEMREELEEGKRAITRLYTMGRERKAEREENKKKFAALNKTIESLKEQSARLESKLEEKTVELDQYKGKFCSARREKKSLQNRVKHLEEHNKLLDSKVKKNKALYLEAKRMLEDERSRARQRSRPPTPQRRNVPTPNRKSRISDGSLDNSCDRTTPIPSPNPSPVPFTHGNGEVSEPIFFTSKQMTPLSSQVVATTPSPRLLKTMKGLSSPIAKDLNCDSSVRKESSDSRCSSKVFEAEDFPRNLYQENDRQSQDQINTPVADNFIDTLGKKVQPDDTSKYEPGEKKEGGFQDIIENLDITNVVAVDARDGKEHLKTTGASPSKEGFCKGVAISESLSKSFNILPARNSTQKPADPGFLESSRDTVENLREHPDSTYFSSIETNKRSFENVSEDFNNANLQTSSSRSQVMRESHRGLNIERLQKFPQKDSAFVYNEIDRGIATPSPKIDLPPSISRVRFDSLSEPNTTSAESCSRDFENPKREEPKLEKNSMSNENSSSFVSPPPRFVKRTRFLEKGFKTDSPELTTDSPLHPKNFANLLYEEDVVVRESPRPVKNLYEADEDFISKTTPVVRQALTMDKIDGEPKQCSVKKTNSWGSKSVGRQVPLSPSFSSSKRCLKRQGFSPGKYSPSRIAGSLSFNPQFFGLNPPNDDAMMGHRFTGLYRWQRVKNETNSVGRRKGSVARSRVWRNHCPFQLQMTAKNLCILYKARGNRNPRLKTFKVRWERAGVNSFETVKVFDPIQISENSEYERWFLFDVNQETKSESNNVSEVLLHFEEENINAVEEVVVLEFDRKFIELAANARNKGKKMNQAVEKTPESGLYLEQYEQDTVYQPAHSRRQQQQFRHQPKGKVKTVESPVAEEFTQELGQSFEQGALTPSELAKLADMCRNYESKKKYNGGTYECSQQSGVNKII